MHSTAPGLDQGATVLFGSRAAAPKITGRRSQALAGLKSTQPTGLVAPLPAPQRIVPRDCHTCWSGYRSVSFRPMWATQDLFVKTQCVTAAGHLPASPFVQHSGNSSSLCPGSPRCRRSSRSLLSTAWLSSQPSSTCCYNHR